MRLLFCYGSNNPVQLSKRLNREVKTKAAFAPNYQRVYRGWSSHWNGGIASLIKKKGSTCYGLVLPINEEDEEKMDAYEGVPFAYTKKVIPVIVDDKRVEAIAYIAKSDEKNKPSQKYLEAICETVSTHWNVNSVKDFINRF